jgi:predicted O-methyltransferase YrrM
VTVSYALRVARLMVTRPREAAERIINRLGAGGQPAVTANPEWRNRLAELLGAPADSVVSWDEEVDAIGADLLALGVHAHDSDPELARAVYLAVRALRPERCVETGVARGVTTRMILEALERNGSGHLWSIDLPPLGDEYAGQSAVAVRDRSRWTFLRGASRKLLPGLLQELGPIDLFLHDSRHTRRNMLMEFGHAWPALRRGGVLIADDVQENAAFAEFFADGRFVVCEESTKQGLFGVALR